MIDARGDGDPFSDKHDEIAHAKARFSAALIENESMRQLVQNGGLDVRPDEAVAFEPTSELLADGRRHLIGLRYSSFSPNGNVAGPNYQSYRYLPLGVSTPSKYVVEPHPEFVDALKLAGIDPTEDVVHGIIGTWQQSWDEMVMALSGKIMFAEDYTLTVLDPTMIEDPDPYL